MLEYTGTNPLEIVNYMNLEEGHVLTEREAEALDAVLQDAFAMNKVREALGIDSLYD